MAPPAIANRKGRKAAEMSPMKYPANTPATSSSAMLYVISDEMIPETHSHGFQKQATYALVAGVVCMLFIEALV